MMNWIIQYWLQILFGFLITFVGSLTKLIYSRLKQTELEQTLLKEGVLALLHDRLYQGCKYHLKNGAITEAEMSNMEYLYKGYHALGGNGTGTELFHRVKDLPLKDSI